MGLLHCDINENSIALGLRPWEERGYLIDFDMNTLQKAGEATPVSSAKSDDELYKSAKQRTSSSPKDDAKKTVKVLQTVNISSTS